MREQEDLPVEKEILLKLSLKKQDSKKNDLETIQFTALTGTSILDSHDSAPIISLMLHVVKE